MLAATSAWLAPAARAAADHVLGELGQTVEFLMAAVLADRRLHSRWAFLRRTGRISGSQPHGFRHGVAAAK